MSFFDFGTETSGNFESSTGDFAPIPKGTIVKVIAEEVTWEQFNADPEFISIKWSIVDGDYKNRKIFQKIRVQDSDPQKAQKANQMLGAINHNAKGGLEKLTHKPSDQELTNALTFKPMLLKLEIWVLEQADGTTKQGNWVSAVSSAQSGASTPSAINTAKGDDDLPF